MRRLFIIIPLLALLTIITGCVTTQVRSYTDNRHSAYLVNSIAILAVSDDIGLSESIEDA